MMGIVIDATKRFAERRKKAEAARIKNKVPTTPSEIRKANLARMVEENK